MYLVAASFVVYLVFFVYCSAFGPERFGFVREFSNERLIVRAVPPGSPAERAGLMPGDRITALGDLPTRDLVTWVVAYTNVDADHPQRVQVERGEQKLELVLKLQRGSLRNWNWMDWLDLADRLVMLTLAFVIVFSRPYDLAARLGGWMLATLSVAQVLPPVGLAVLWRQLPWPISALLWIPTLSFMALSGTLVSFFAIFPRALFRGRWWWIAVWTPLFLVMLPFLPWVFFVYYQPSRASSLPNWYIPVFTFTAVGYVLGALAVLVLNYRRLEEVNERRRVRVLVVGTIVAWLAVLPNLLAIWLGGSLAQAYLTTPVAKLSPLFFLALPLSFAYAILRHRLFDIRVMIRQGLQYALARRLVLALVPVLAAILIADLLLHGDQPLLGVLRARGWVYVVLGGVAAVAHARRKEWLETLDRRFFRERYDAQHLLREVVEEVREAQSFERVAPRVVARIEAALHPEFAALLVLEPGAPVYRTLAAAPAGQAPPQLSAQSKLVGLMRLLGKPLQVSSADSGWLAQQLPHEETDFLRRARIDFVVPVAMSAEHAEALLVLGAKRSEEPYSREDQELLLAIAASLALLLEKPAAPAPRVSAAFEECPQCGTCYDTGAGRCAQDLTALALKPLPRLLAERYRLDRRLGQGGMGTVYEATDTALERRVAVKLIREDLVGSAEAAERFRREARVAAGFAHPHVVTVHDFGVAESNRAFLVMELLSGISLREALRREARLRPPRVLAILGDVCAAVDAAHRKQLVHRDLKPENIFLAHAESGETSKVLDFGIAKFLPSDTQVTVDTSPGALAGTLRYMAPEQLRGGAVEAAWDLWALAVVTYEMLTGTCPFPTASSAALHSAVLAGHFTPVPTHLAEAPEAWQRFFERALSADAQKRPGSAPALLAELRKALA
jgi:tRNA A-37 threonylcarbamoyl transferase component Bud32